MARSALPRGLANTLLAILSILVALVVVELGLRLFFYGTLAAPDYSQSFHEPHPTRGWTLRPNVTARQQELDFNAEVSINSKGVRGPDIDYARTPGVFRILFVSDSAMFGSGVEYDHTVPAVLKELLAPLPVEIVNLSVAAYSTTQEYVLFMEEGRKYRPDLVLLGFAPGNDIQTNYAPLQRLFQKSQRRPFAGLDAGGRLTIDYQHAEQAAQRSVEKGEPGAIDRFFTDLVLVRLVKAAVHKFTGDKRVDPNIFLGWSYLAEFDERYSLNGMTKADYEKLWGEAWRVTQALIGAMQDESHAMGARFGIFVSTAKLQGDPATQARVLEAFPGVALDVGKIDREVERFAAEIGAPFIPILPDVEAAAADLAHPLYFGFEDEHWTVTGNRVVAEALAKGLQANGLLPAP